MGRQEARSLAIWTSQVPGPEPEAFPERSTVSARDPLIQTCD